MIIEYKNGEELKNVIENSEYCLLLVGSLGCSKCKGLATVLDKVYQQYPYIKYLIASESVVNQITKPYIIHAMSVLFYKNGIRKGLAKYLYAPQAYARRIEQTLLKD